MRTTHRHRSARDWTKLDDARALGDRRLNQTEHFPSLSNKRPYIPADGKYSNVALGIVPTRDMILVCPRQQRAYF